MRRKAKDFKNRRKSSGKNVRKNYKGKFKRSTRKRKNSEKFENSTDTRKFANTQKLTGTNPNDDSLRFENTKRNSKANCESFSDANKRKRQRGTRDADSKVKRQKTRESSENETGQSSESESEDHMKQLRQTFINIGYKGAIDSEDSESDDDIDEKIDSNEECESFSEDKESLDKHSRKSSAEHSQEETLDELLEERNPKEMKDLKNNLQEEDLLENNEAEDTEEESELDPEAQRDDKSDPFVKHLFNELSDSLLKSVQSVPMEVESHVENWPVLGELQIQIPRCEEQKQNVEQTENNKQDLSQLNTLEEKKTFAEKGAIPRRITTKTTPEELHVKSQIIPNLKKANGRVGEINSENPLPLSSFQAELFSIVNNYQDLYYPERNFDNCDEIRFVYCLHAINHIVKTRTKVLHHNAKLNKKDNEIPEEFRDQGLVRPKVLIIVPFKDSAFRVVKTLIDVLLKEDKGNVFNKNRFVEDYTGNEIVMPKKNPKPEDYEMIFRGNVSDDFKIGLTVTKKSLKLYANFYSSDIIIASPLGLRYTIGAEGEQERDYDFLASIEVLVFDQTEIFLMQNWDHVLHILNHVHLQPKEHHGTDFSRVRHWSLNGWSKYYRQTLVFSSAVLPEINAIFNKKCFNYSGKVRVNKRITNGAVKKVFVQLPHVFMKFVCGNVSEAVDARFDFFVGKVLTQQRDPLMKQTLIFIPNYFDYVRIRNYFKKEDIRFVQICEYTKEGKVARARDMFYHGDAHFMLYTERFHFFNRIRVKGIRHLIFYQPPNFSHFYYEMCNLMQEGYMNKKIGSDSNMTVTVLYCKYDVHQLAAIVGTERAAKMLQSDRNVHMLLTEGE